MADEPRRSGRSTKGQHKNLDMVTEAPSKKSKGKPQTKDKHAKPSAEPTPAPSEEEEIIRCICGEYEEEEDVERDMICCDRCSAWQHNDCMGLTFAKGQEPDEYFCEQCKPENHVVLLEKMARGEKPWEEAAERRRRDIEEKKASRRKKGRRGGRKSKAAEGRPEPPSTPGPVPAQATPSTTSITPVPAPPAAATPEPEEQNGHKEEEKDEPRPASNQKRKFDEDQQEHQAGAGPKMKQQKVSPPAPSTITAPIVSDTKATPGKRASTTPASRQSSVIEKATPEAVTPLEDPKNPARKSVANALVKLFVDQISEARKRGSFKLPHNKLGEEVARRLGLSIENAMYQNICGGSGETTEPYKLQLRTILFNVKKNPSLRDRLLVGSLSAEAISKMSSQDMASEELQQKDAEIKREADRQHIIVQEQGPRIRRTHKGEELVEDETHTATSEPVFSTVPTRLSIVEADGSPSVQSPVSPTIQQNNTDASSSELQAKSAKAKAADGMDHDHTLPPGGHSPRGSLDDQMFPEVSTQIREPVHHGKVQADAEIDKLLRDDEPDSPPYSPREFADEGTVWRGKVVMNPIAEFASFAKHVGGADLSGRIPWSQLAPSTLLVDGRIDIQLASNYLCGLRFSTSTDVTVISVRCPESTTDRAGFDKLFNYFADRKRYGVVGKHPLAAVKDVYLIPVEAGATKKPEFIELLENNSLEDHLPGRVLLVVFVVKTGESNPPSQHSSMEPGSAGTPLSANAANNNVAFSTPGPRPVAQVAPTPSGPSSVATPTPAHPSSYNNSIQQQRPSSTSQPSGGYQQPPSPSQAPIGMAAAVQVLGAQANSPAIQQLLQQAPNADIIQLNVVRDILVQRPEAAADYTLLMQALYQATTVNEQQNRK
ncbi:hypothetical protein ASPZODRAFT_143965 [Penicilliopsis zonata CBS 506.65]|uniref:Transcription factor BYE1 n=1 Tax=Penicilliopsis zonata CBS 506.65 TaxID=1073090 RepID=A0A1L9SDV7_9EURO|nr:hypothetical protein ASPZODRAFT_143965 [Penicilliopsis zonata CBS 506.65]OJJ45328.1 hypothetical protein ASPZODRAFT_143965 [Penicilliopsis zonata CBS 506.65]